MNKLFSKICTGAAFLAFCLMAAPGCGETEQAAEAPYMDAVPAEYTQSALGEGDGFLISVRSNVAWTLSAVDGSGNPVDWIVFDQTEGNGNADVFGVVLRGDRETDRNCTIVLSSADGKMEKRLSMRQGIFIPVMLSLTLSNAINLGYPLAVGGTDDLTDFGLFDAEVVGVPGENLPAEYAYITDGTYFVRMKTPQAASLKVGDQIQVEMTNGKITKDAPGVYTIDIPEPVTVKASGAPTVAPAYIAPEALARYEHALVELRDVQAQDSYVGKAWSGDAGLLTTDELSDYNFSTHVESGASFASTNIPNGNGTIVGIVVDGKVRPRTAADINLTGERGSVATEPYTIKPIANMLKGGSAANTYANGSVSGATKFTFTAEPDFSVDGASIEKVTGTNNQMALVVALASPFQSCFTTRQWHLAGSYMLYTIPVNQRVYGDLSFDFSLSCGTANVFAGDWNVYWSTDNVNYKPVDACYTTATNSEDVAQGNKFKFSVTGYAANRQVAEFHIPEEEAVTSGNIYIKMVSPTVASSKATTTLRMNNGSILHTKEKNTPKRGYHHVVAMENFERSLFGHSPVIGVPTYYFAHCTNNPAYSSTEGWAVSGSSIPVRGCLQLSATSGANYVISPILDKLTAKTDLTVTFKAAPYVLPTGATLVVNSNNITAAVSGSGTASEITWDSTFESNPYAWHTGTFTVTGAGPDTQINLGVLESGFTNSRFYIDDIIIKR